jgi:hypothetical protein
MELLNYAEKFRENLLVSLFVKPAANAATGRTEKKNYHSTNFHWLITVSRSA